MAASAHSYRAYPLFRAPRETALAAATPEQLADQMNEFSQPAPRSQARSRNQSTTIAARHQPW
jgi:hypothetical protein